MKNVVAVANKMSEAFGCTPMHTENFRDGMNDAGRTAVDVIISLFFMVVIVLVFAFVGTMLWNNYAVKYITVLKPINDMVGFIALMFLTGMLF